jgi:hypothetical protein
MDLSDVSEKLGIDPGTFRLVAQRLNHYATPGPWRIYIAREKILKSAFIIPDIFALVSNTKLYGNPSGGRRAFTCKLTDRQTDKRTDGMKHDKAFHY